MPQGSYKDLGYNKNLSRLEQSGGRVPVGGDLDGFLPRPSVKWSSGNEDYDLRYLKLSGGTMTGDFVPEVFSQDAEPDSDDIGAGAMAFWIDTNDANRLYICYNQGGTIKTAELT